MLHSTTRPRTLVQCIGNRLRRDDGVGPVVAGLLQRGDPPPDAQVTKHWGEGAELMQHWERAQRVILVDAARSGAAPGTIHRFDAHEAPIPRDFFYYTSHRFGVAEAVETARALGILPPELTLYAVEGEDFDQGEGLSPAVASAAERVAEKIRRQLTTDA